MIELFPLPFAPTRIKLSLTSMVQSEILLWLLIVMDVIFIALLPLAST